VQKRKDFQASITKLEGSIAQEQKDFQSKLAEQQKQIKALTSGLEKVNAQLEASKKICAVFRS
jgi:hypothetical protein